MRRRCQLHRLDDATAYAAALREARTGLAEGGTPIGACLVVDGKVLASGRNQRVQPGSAIRHGETDCIEEALPRAHDVEVVVLDDAETITIFRAWLEANPALWNEDIGEEG